ncbi:uncharacterized protein BDZ99DRAFT_431188 [Mytilinidion resinicola]|uniref:Protein EFR3 n=1 Tax=Mytilinidion resinicola TaxID=574789 RepID=A0A6A6ZAC9_9PEZI|nr:uncharacterized protein BDZ99DRAFT_431188 [Mytilinidion resinicola]KAF2817245.1 hypothetical protein BDZ99DRAFT_431188 [Mytilinidion resinicola]
MHAARQACRPKHQVLVLKCYPKFQKNNTDVKPNSSELSYLLYYASTRRSKLQKVGDFLDKRATSDVWKGRLGNVQVTLEILKAIIEKCPRDLPLYAGSVLSILRTILRSHDITMVEESVPTFETFCAHQDPATLAADQEYIKQYEDTVRLYAEFASKEAVAHAKTPISLPVAIRFRKAGLKAINGIASSESLGSETGRQLAAILPAILLNIYSDSGEYLDQLVRREEERGDLEKQDTLRRRQSVSTVLTADTAEGDPVAASGTTEDADKIAEEEVGLVALQALRNIFKEVNRNQLRLATSAVLKFIASRVKPHDHFKTHDNRPCHNGSWPTTLFAMICGWATVQDRFVILVGAMETLVQSPIKEEDIERQLVLATIIDYLLSSQINFIGLSVMDVLIGLISHTLLLLQLGGHGSNIVPHPQQADAVGSLKEKGPTSSGSLTGAVVMELVKTPSDYRLQLLATLQKCMASLATHVYYTDQVADMLRAVLSRLKPSSQSDIPTTVAAIDDPVGAVDAVASSANLQEKTGYVDSFFSFETARITALATVKEILIVANSKKPDGSSTSDNRRQVEVGVWEGTQWLIRDPNGQVRKAYADALLTWLNLELRKKNLRVVQEVRPAKTEIKEKENGIDTNLAKRAVSNASHREKAVKRSQAAFITMLHLAIYENAHQHADSEPDILLLHLLLTNLVEKMGVNSVKSGLPMIMRLQEDIQLVENPGSKIRLGSLVHGYFWALSVAFDFETSSIGRALHSEITRRKDKGLWLRSVRIPPVPLNQIELPATYPGLGKLSPDLVQTEALKPFDNREALVDLIADGYTTSLASPPSSPPASPGLPSRQTSRQRSASMVKTSRTLQLDNSSTLPAKIKDQMMADWSKAACIASTTQDSSSSASISNSRTGTTSGTARPNNLLAASIPNGTLDSNPANSPHHAFRQHSRPPSAAYGLVGHGSSPNRNGSPMRSGLSSSSVHSAVRVEDLKRVLEGRAPRSSYTARGSVRGSAGYDDDTGSESMVSVSEMSYATANDRERDADAATVGSSGDGANSDGSATPKVLSMQPPASTSSKDFAGKRDAVPPVPPLPPSLRASSVSPAPIPAQGTGGRPRTAPGKNTHGDKRESANGSVRSLRQSRSLKRGEIRSQSGSRDGARLKDGKGRIDFYNLLDAIGVEDNSNGEEDDVGSGGARTPPY